MTQQKRNDGFLSFALPDFGEEEIAEVVDSLRSGWVTTGPKARRFESDFAEFIGGGVSAIAVNSATAGLHLALESIGVKTGDEVIVPSYTFTATGEVVRYLGADPVFVDVDAATLNLDPDKVEKAITVRTRAIIPVHFAGLACDIDALLAIAQHYNLKVVEDAAHALPSTSKGRLIGALDTDATVFSFYATKTITTGEGGMVVTRNPQIAERCRVMRLHGISRDAFDRYTSIKPSWHYEVIAPGYKYNLTDIAAALGLHQLRKAWRFQERRCAMAARYHEAFADLPVELPASGGSSGSEKEDVHAWHLYVLRLRPEAPMDRNTFISRMAEQEGIGCSVHFIPMHLHPYWRDRYRLVPNDFPISLKAYGQAVSLPLYTRMTDTDQERVIQSTRKLLS